MSVLMANTMKRPEETMREIREVLGQFGAHDFGTIGPAKGEPTGVTFRLLSDESGRTRRIPVNWRRVYARLQAAYADGQLRKSLVTEKQARAAAWRQLYHYLRVTLEVSQGGLLTEDQILSGLEIVPYNAEVTSK